jgi:diguanylate cyclase (GGDEF)-like protein
MKIKEVLAKLVDLTRERDCNSLELSLAQTLFDLVVPERIAIYRPIRPGAEDFSMTTVGHGQPVEIGKSLCADLVRCIVEGTPKQHGSDVNRPIMLYPLQSLRQQVVGVVAIELPEHSPAMKETVDMLLQIYHNFIDLINENERDTLTGLLNRKTFERKMNSIKARQFGDQERRAADGDGLHYLAIFDIDHFKHVNDTFGHLIGDEVLLLFAQLMARTFREQDLLFRFGGEEFVAVFHCDSSENMQKVLDRFRGILQAFSFPQVGQVTVSIGFTEINTLDASANMVERADLALYHAKNNGRNQVCHYESLVKSGALVIDQKEGDIELF